VVLLCGLIACSLSACREAEPEVAFNQPMVDSYEEALPPVAPAKCDAKVAGGTAEWVEFRTPDLEEMADTGPGGAVKAAVRALVTEYNDLVNEGEYASLPEYYVEKQQEAAERVIQAKASVVDTLNELGELLKEQTPEQSDAVDELIEPLLERYSLALNLDWIEVVDERQATATRILPGLTASAPAIEVPLNFVLVEEEWFIDSPGLRMSVMLIGTVESSAGIYQTWMAMLQGGMMPATEVLRQLALGAAMTGHPIPEGIDMTPPPPAAMTEGMPPGGLPPGMTPPAEEAEPEPPPQPSG